MNLAEVVHAGWANRDNRNLSLLDVAQVDVKDSVLLKAELKAIEQETSWKKNQMSSSRITEAAQLGQEVESLAAGLEVDRKSGHCPLNTKSRRGKNRRKNCNTQKKPTVSGHTQSQFIGPSQPVIDQGLSQLPSQTKTFNRCRKRKVVNQAQSSQKYNGCGSDFAEKYGRSPHKIIADTAIAGSWGEMTILRSFCMALTSGLSHIQWENPLFTGKVSIDFDKYQTMDSEQRAVIKAVLKLLYSTDLSVFLPVSKLFYCTLPDFINFPMRFNFPLRCPDFQTLHSWS